MAKYPHRLFEMFDLPDEAIVAITPRRASSSTEPIAAKSWTLKHLSVTNLENITHLKFNSAEFVEDETGRELNQDFTQLADGFQADTKVLLDFAGVESFGPAAINAISLFKQKLTIKGSRLALCSLAPAVRESFFSPR